MYMLGLYMGRKKGIISDEVYKNYIDELLAVPDKLTSLLKQEKKIEALAKKLYKRNNVFFIGRGNDAAVAYEGSLKLKEIS